MSLGAVFEDMFKTVVPDVSGGHSEIAFTMIVCATKEPSLRSDTKCRLTFLHLHSNQGQFLAFRRIIERGLICNHQKIGSQSQEN